MPNNRSLSTMHLLALASLIEVTLLGCWPGKATWLGDETRLQHYRDGGSFFGGGPAVSPDGEIVAFATPKSGNGDIYRVKIDGTDLSRLTTSADYECDPDFSPDGKSIVFVRESKGQGDIWIMNSDGTDQRRLTTTAGDKDTPKFVSNEQVIFCWTDPKLKSNVGVRKAHEIWLLDIATGVASRITNNQIGDFFPNASRDGKYFSFSRDDGIWIYDRLSSSERNIGEGSNGAFSPDGQSVAVIAGEFGRQVDIVKIEGAERSTIYSKNTTVSHPVYLPDGKGVLFLESPYGDGVGNLLWVELETLSVHAVVNTK